MIADKAAVQPRSASYCAAAICGILNTPTSRLNVFAVAHEAGMHRSSTLPFYKRCNVVDSFIARLTHRAAFPCFG